MEEQRSFQKARQICFRLLKFRPRSEHEIREKLKAKEFSCGIIDESIAYFAELGLIDDADFARKWVSYRLLKPFGFKRIKTELIQKGIAKEIIEEVLREASLEVDEETQVRSVVERKARTYGNIDQSKLKQRLYNYLLRRGFNPQTVYHVVKEYDR